MKCRSLVRAMHDLFTGVQSRDLARILAAAIRPPALTLVRPGEEMKRLIVA